jgi:hypothetical protein
MHAENHARKHPRGDTLIRCRVQGPGAGVEGMLLNVSRGGAAIALRENGAAPGQAVEVRIRRGGGQVRLAAVVRRVGALWERTVIHVEFRDPTVEGQAFIDALVEASGADAPGAPEPIDIRRWRGREGSRGAGE